MTDQTTKLQTLSDLPAKARAFVRALCGGRDFTSRMGTMGFVPGSLVTVIQNYGRGPVLVIVKDGQIALGRGEALKVLVERLPEAQGKHDCCASASFIAKENTIAVLGILYSAETELGLARQIAGALSPSSALAFLVIQMTFIPCIATVAAIKQETGWRWTGLTVGLLLILSLCFGILTYQVARLAGLRV